MDGGTLAPEVGEGNQVSQAALPALRKYDRLHYFPSQPKSLDYIAYTGARVKRHEPRIRRSFIHKNMHRPNGPPRPPFSLVKFLTVFRRYFPDQDAMAVFFIR